MSPVPAASPKMWLARMVALGAIIMTLSLVACELGSASGGRDGAGQLTVYSGRAETLIGPLINDFRNLTGIEVEVRYGNTPAMAATLLEEGSRSPADVFFAQDPGGLGAVEDLLAPLPESILERAPEWARSPEGHWVGVSGRARVLVYNTDRVDPSELPADIWDLTDPEWRGRIGWAPTNGSFLTMIAGMRQYWGEERTQEWVEGMVANRPRVYNNNSSQVEAAGSGEIDIGLVNHYYLYQFLAERGEEFKARNHHPGEGPGALIMISGAGVLSGAGNQDNAERFVEFLLSQTAQQYFASQTYEYPVVEGVSTHPLLTPLDQINRPDLPVAAMADLEGATELLRRAGALP